MSDREGGLSEDDVTLDAEELAILADQHSPPEPVPADPATPAPDPVDRVLAATPDTIPADAATPQAPAPVDAAPAVPALAPEPFAFTADGTKVAVTGATVAPDGTITMPRDTWNRVVQPHLADRRQWQLKEQSYRQQIEERDPAQNAEVLRARAILGTLTALMDQGPEKMAEWLDDFERNRPILQAQAETAVLKAQYEAQQSRLTEVDQREFRNQQEPLMRQGLEREVQAQLAADPSLAGLLQGPLVERLMRNMQQTFVVADRDYPEYGISRGEIALNLAYIRSEVQDIAQLTANARATRQAQAAAQTANARTLNPQTPPGLSTKGTPAGAQRQPVKAKTSSEWADDFMSMPVDTE